MQAADTRKPLPVPAVVWVVAGLVALLRLLPFARLAVMTPPAGLVAVPAPYVAKDWLAYVALVRQGAGLLSNPFTTDAQDGRMVFLLHQTLGAIHEATGADPFWLLELSRIPLLFAFAAVVWRFTGALGLGSVERKWASVLVLASGGFGWLVLATLSWWPEPIRLAAGQDLWTAYGWSTFDSAFNPLWLAGLTLAWATLRPLLQPGGPLTARDRTVAALGFTATWLVHPYSAIVIAAAAGGAIASEWLSGAPASTRLRNVAVALLVPACAILALVAWQRGDPAYRAASSGFFGQQAASVSWYPIAFGALGFFAVRGLRDWARVDHPWRHGIAGWVGSVVLLHSSNVVNGYHFVFALHGALALLAASPIARWYSSRTRGVASRTAATALAVALFAAPLATTAIDVRAADTSHVTEPVARLLASIATAPAARVLAPPNVGNLIPAFGPHRVYVGHWFMTPDHDARAAWYHAVVSDPARAPELRTTVLRERIGMVVLPARAAYALVPALALPIASIDTFGDLVLLRISLP